MREIDLNIFFIRIFLVNQGSSMLFCRGTKGYYNLPKSLPRIST